MNDRILIFAGLAIFLLAATYPFWQTSQPEAMPNLAKVETKGDQCVAPVEYMRDNHMLLLDEWRHSVVRDGDRFHTMPDGSKVEKSLTKTCLGCHVSQQQFCEECHTYASVKPYCWECHVIPVAGEHARNTENNSTENNKLVQDLLARNQVQKSEPFKAEEVQQ